MLFTHIVVNEMLLMHHRSARFHLRTLKWPHHFMILAGKDMLPPFAAASLRKAHRKDGWRMVFIGGASVARGNLRHTRHNSPLLFISLLLQQAESNQQWCSTRPTNGSRSQPLLGHALQYRRNPAKFLVDKREKIGDLFQLNLAGKQMIVVCGPEKQRIVASAPESSCLHDEPWPMSALRKC